MKEPRAHSIRELRALGATAQEYWKVTGEFPEEWNKEWEWPVYPGATAETQWIRYLVDQGRLD